jgi:RNA polymerase sigma-70 factor (ECF subfamily)
MDLSEEKQLVELAQRDPQVFAKVYDHYYPRIFQYALKRTADVHLAQDITSETFFKALKKLWQFRWRNLPFSSWLYRIATNEVNQYFRKRKYHAASLDEMQESGFEPIANGNPETELIEAQEKLKHQLDFLACQRIVSQMDVKYQEVIALRFFERKEIKEIGQILGKSEGTIKSLLHRGLEKLQKAMSGSSETQPLEGQRIVETGQVNTKIIEPS